MKNNYGLQLYSVRDSSERDFEKTIEQVAKIGYHSVEFAGFFNHSATEVKKMLSDNALEISGTHSPWTDLCPTRICDTLRYHTELGNPYYIIPGADLSTPEKMDRFVNVINYAQPVLAAEGIKLAYHNHSREFLMRPCGTTIHAELERRTNLNFEVDTYWVFNAGCDPIAVMERLKDRIDVIHLKDGLSDGKGMALGEGEAPVAAVWKKALEMGFSMVVESETLSPSGIEEVTRCFNYLVRLDSSI
ncbi:MAG: sugar phosphate isomerase/epimerase family protein [Eubacteriales bacterium]